MTNEIIYKLKSDLPMKNSDIYMMKKRLEILDYIENVTDDIYDIQTKNAIKSFQSDNKLKITGEVDNETFNSLMKITKTTDNQNNFYMDNRAVNPEEEDTFFNNDKSELFRKGELKINIKYGKDKNITIENVKLYNKDQIIDSNGEAIYDVYQFVAKDIKE